MIKKHSPLYYTIVRSGKGLELQTFAGQYGFRWPNGKHLYNPYFPTYALVIEPEELLMYYYPVRDAPEQLPDGKVTIRKLKEIIKGVRNEFN